ncbi:hypothetical protein DFH09DRAFT_1161701 [Mycena vulgaris]|nr:hypothetical protein DFH09DRAFT_1161701 [Mycena vulgaris]
MHTHATSTYDHGYSMPISLSACNSSGYGNKSNSCRRREDAMKPANVLVLLKVRGDTRCPPHPRRPCHRPSPHPSRPPVAMRCYDRPHDGAHERELITDAQGSLASGSTNASSAAGDGSGVRMVVGRYEVRCVRVDDRRADAAGKRGGIGTARENLRERERHGEGCSQHSGCAVGFLSAVATL